MNCEDVAIRFAGFSTKAGKSGTHVTLRLYDCESRTWTQPSRRCARAGATVIFPIVEFCGVRMARLRDPCGHLWLLIQRSEELSPDEIERRRNAWVPPQLPPKT